MSPTETEKIVTGADAVVVTVVGVDDVVDDGVVGTDVETGGVLVVVVEAGRDEVGVVAGGCVLFVQANTLVRTNKDRTNKERTLPNAGLFIFISVVYPK
jgi:hypothetical protein